MTTLLVMVALTGVALLQSTLVARLRVWGVFPDLPLLVVVSWALLRGRREGLVWGAIGGLAVDGFSGAPPGAAALPMMAVGWLAGLGAAHVSVRHNWALPLLAMGAATLLYDLGFLAVVAVSGGRVAWLDSLWRLIVPSALLNAAGAPLVVGGLRALYRRLHRDEVGL